MKLIVFGATGGTGRSITQQALEAGFEVTAFVRTPSKVTLVHPNLRVFEGDVSSGPRVREAMRSPQAVLSALGFGRGHDSTSLVHSTGTEHILGAMREFDVRRIICETTVLTGEAAHLMSTAGKWYLRVMNLLHPHFLREKERQEQLIMASHLDWTIVRPAVLTDGPRTGSFKVGRHLRSDFSSRISRADVASFMLGQVTSTEYLHQAPTIMS